MTSKHSLLIFLSAISLTLWTGCSGDDPVRGQSCQSDRDCNGGLCQAGTCTPPTSSLDGGQGDASDADGEVTDDTVEIDGDIIEQPDESDDTAEDTPATNACGGTATLDGEPGDSCGVCEDGELACAGPNALRCESASSANICGGCGPLPGIPGAHCGDCSDGQWVCAEGHLECTCEEVEANGTCAAPFLLELGDVEQIDLCGLGDNQRQVAGPTDCRDTNSRGEEVVYTFELTRTTTVVVDLRDDDDSAAIDTIVYLRSRCDAENTQLICSDDVLCADSVFDPSLCTGPVQVRQSHFETELEADTYFLIADSFNYTQDQSYSCGTVRLSIED